MSGIASSRELDAHELVGVLEVRLECLPGLLLRFAGHRGEPIRHRAAGRHDRVGSVDSTTYHPRQSTKPTCHPDVIASASSSRARSSGVGQRRRALSALAPA